MIVRIVFLFRKRKSETDKKEVMKYMKEMSKRGISEMGYHKAYLKADAASRNLNLERFRLEDSSSDSESSGDETESKKGQKTKNVS